MRSEVWKVRRYVHRLVGAKVPNTIESGRFSDRSVRLRPTIASPLCSVAAVGHTGDTQTPPSQLPDLAQEGRTTLKAFHRTRQLPLRSKHLAWLRVLRCLQTTCAA